MELLESTCQSIRPLDAAATKKAVDRMNNLTMPKWALGTLCDVGVKLSGIFGIVPPSIDRRCIITMAGDHGVVDEGVSRSGRDVTQQMVANFAAGGAGVNVLGRLNNARVIVADFGMAGRDESLIASGALLDYSVAKGTANLAKGPAMTRDQAIQSIENGIALATRFAPEMDVFGTGEMGIGNTTPATAIVVTFTGRPVRELCGAGTGLDEKGVAHKTKVIENGLRLNKPNADDALDILAKVGGFEIGGIAGLILGAAAARKAVIVDGFISSAGAMLAKKLCPAVMDYVFLAHASAEPGHAAMCAWLGQKPLLDLGLRLGEGTGAAMALNVLGGACGILREMATFDSAGVNARHTG